MNSSTPAIEQAPARRWPRWLVASLVVLALLILGIAWYGGPRSRLIADLQARGGYYSEWHADAFYVRSVLAMLGQPNNSLHEVLLAGEQFDDAWYSTTDDLAALGPNSVQLLETGLGRESIHRLLARHQWRRLIAYDSPLTDAEAELLHDDIELMSLSLRKTQVTDGGLRRIPLANVYDLDVSESPITGPALSECLAGIELMSITLDGRQFTPELARFLGTVPQLQKIGLVGAEITDEHLVRLSALPALHTLALEETSVTPEALAAIRAAHPGWRIYVDRQQIQP